MLECIPSFGQIVFLVVTYFSLKLAFAAYKSLKKDEKPPLKRSDWKKDVVYLAQFPRNRWTAQLSPFCLRVESFLRMHKIKYELIEETFVRSKKGQLPFIELNGEQYCDSQIILFKLEKHFNIKEDLNEEQQAIARMMDRMLDGSVFNAAHYLKFRADMVGFCSMLAENYPMGDLIKYPMALAFKSRVMARFYSEGSARHSISELKEILRRDFKAIATILGNKKFLFGDKPHEIDCTLFGHMSSFTFLPYDHEAKQILRDEFPTIRAHMDRMAKMFFSEYKFVEK